jgi:hypothetical protein
MLHFIYRSYFTSCLVGTLTGTLQWSTPGALPAFSICLLSGILLYIHSKNLPGILPVAL